MKKSATIVHGNALRVDWDTIIGAENNSYDFITNKLIVKVEEPITHYETLKVKANSISKESNKKQSSNKVKFDYIFGNPPFIGSRIMDESQKHDLIAVFENVKNVGDMDYVTGWYIKAAKFIQGTKTKVAFVSTNSIVQGLQTSILWGQMLNKYAIIIHFAHRTFKWSNEAKGNAAVYCVIVGFGTFDTSNKIIFEYEDIKGEAHAKKVKNINPYLLEGKNILIERQQNPICNVPEMCFGNMPADGGELLFTTDEKNAFLQKEPNSINYFRKFVGSQEYINNIERWCLWLQDSEPSELKKMNYVLERVNNVILIREKSSRPQLASIPHLFAQITQPKGQDYIIVPSVSSERRKFIPIGFENANVIASNLCLIVPNATIYHFGILTSTMHMAWVKSVCGRLKSDFRYSKDIVYNNYPWPSNPTQKQKELIEKAAQKVLDARLEFPISSLADLYDPLTMPPVLSKAHQELDKAVDLAYRPQPFTSEANRMEFLFELYEKYTSDLFTKEKGKKK